MTELSDEEVGLGQPRPGELSDAEVFGTQPQPNTTFFDMPESDRQVSRLLPNVNHIMKGLSAFGEGFKEGLQPESLGLSEESRAWLASKNVLPKDANDYTNPMKPFMAFNEGIILPLAVGIDAVAKSPMALYRGLQSLGMSRGLPGDIVSIPDAFMGSPHPLGIPQVPLAKPQPFVKPVDIKPIESSPNPGVLRSVAAKTNDPLIDAILDHPVLKQVIDNPVVDDSHTIPNSLGGSEPINNPTLYRDKDFPKTMTVDGVTFDTAEPSAVHENVEEFVIDALTKSGMDQATALKVAFWNFGEVAEDAWYRAHGMDPEKVEAKYTKHLDEIASRKKPDEHKGADYIKRVSQGDLDTPSVDDLSNLLTEIRKKDRESSGLDEKTYNRLAQLNREIDRGSDAAIAEKEAILAKLPKDLPEPDIPDEGQIRQLRTEFGSLEKTATESPQEYVDGIARVLKRYISDFTSGDDFARSVFRKAFDEAKKHGIDTKKLGNEVIDRFQSDLSSSDQAFMRGEFAKFTAPKLSKPSGVPPDLFKGTYPDGDPAKAGPGPIDRPTPEESVRGRQMLEGYLAGEGNPSGIVAFHASPHVFEKFDFSKIGTGEGVQAYGRGGYFAQKEGVAKDYLDQFNQRSGAEHDAQMYQVSIKADPEHFLDWDKPLSEQSEHVQKALKPFNLKNTEEGGYMHQEIYRQLGGDTQEGVTKAADALREAGIPGIKYLDQGSRNTDEFITRRSDDGKFYVEGGGLSKYAGPFDTREEARTVADAKNAEGQTRNYVVFDDNLVQITHVNGQPILDAARDLGVTGPPKLSLAEGKPADVAARTVGGEGGAGKPPGGGIGEPPQGGPGGGGEPPQPGANPWRDRFEHFVGKLDAGEDVKQLIREAADQKGEFPAARQGDIKLSKIEDMAIAAGVEPEEINQRGLGRLLKNDAEVDTAIRLMLQAADNMKDAAREVRATRGVAQAQALIKLQESIMRRDLAVEQVVGLRAEWGRTGNTIQKFLTDVKDQEGLSNFLKDKGRTPKDLRDIADAVDTLDRGQAARFMNDMRTPTGWDKFMWYWVNALISGPVTHAKYVIANAAFAGYESAVVTPVAGLVGTVRRAMARLTPAAESEGYRVAFRLPDGAIEVGNKGEIHTDLADRRGLDIFAEAGSAGHLEDGFVDSKGNFFDRQQMADKMLPESGEDLRDVQRARAKEGVFIGEAGARLWGLVAGTPDAIVAAAKAARTGLQTPLPGEIAQNILPKQNKGLAFQQKPIEGPVGTLIGIPSRGAAGIHSFFNFLGYRASMEAQAYRAAAKEGLSPTDQAFWERRQGAVDAPTKEMMDNGIEEGYRLTYISELSPAGKLMSRAIKSTKAGQLLLPFTHIPFNILSRGLEGTPAAFLTAETRADVFGKNGAVKQDMAVARLVAGSAVGAWAVNLVLNDQMTGYGPSDPKERAQWTATGHQPYSIRIGDEWYSFNRFGSLGTMLGLHANLAEAIPHLKPEAEELTKALVMTVHSTGRLLEDEVGMQGLAGLIDAINDPERKGTRFVSNFAGSLLPYSSLLRQTASAMDPEMRETKSVVDGLRYYIPVMRQDLLPKRDWLGDPITNAGYGGDLPIPGLSAIIQHRPAEAAPIAEEMKRLDLHPAEPTNRVGGVKLPPKLYDQYQMAAGQLTRQVLYNWVAQPTWHQMPEFARAEVFRRSIAAARQQAGAMMMGMYPQIIQQGVQQRVDQINGVKPTKLKD